MTDNETLTETVESEAPAPELEPTGEMELGNAVAGEATVPVAALVAERKKRQDAEARLADALKVKKFEPVLQESETTPVVEISDEDWILRPQEAAKKLIDAKVAAETSKFRAELAQKEAAAQSMQALYAATKKEFPDYDAVVSEEFRVLADEMGMTDRAAQTENPFKAMYAMAKRWRPTPIVKPQQATPPSKPQTIASISAAGSNVRSEPAPTFSAAFASVMRSVKKG